MKQHNYLSSILSGRLPIFLLLCTMVAACDDKSNTMEPFTFDTNTWISQDTASTSDDSNSALETNATDSDSFLPLSDSETTSDSESPDTGTDTDTNTNTDTSTDTNTDADTSTSTSTSTSTDTDTDTDTDAKEPIIITTEGAFSVVMLPDTQSYIAWKKAVFDSQVDWIIDNASQRSIQFIGHEGDIIQSNGSEPEEWVYAQNLMAQIGDFDIPYAIVPGNHDYDESTGRESTMFNNYFPLASFQSMPSFGGSFTATESDNTFHIMNVNGIKLLFLMLEFGPRDSVLDWANNVLADYSDYIAILVTHGYLNEDSSLLGPNDNHSPTNGYGFENTNDGEDMWEKLVKPNNIRFVFSGHVGTSEDGAGRLESTNSAGNNVYQMLANFQYFAWEDTGYFRIMEFSPTENLIAITTYSPYIDAYKTDSENQFEVTDITLTETVNGKK